MSTPGKSYRNASGPLKTGSIAMQKYESMRFMERFYRSLTNPQPHKDVTDWKDPNRGKIKFVRNNNRQRLQERTWEAENAELAGLLHKLQTENRKDHTKETGPGWRSGGVARVVIDCYETQNPLAHRYAELHGYEKKRAKRDKEILRDNLALERKKKNVTSDLSAAKLRESYDANRRRARFFFNKHQDTELHLNLMSQVRQFTARKEREAKAWRDAALAKEEGGTSVLWTGSLQGVSEGRSSARPSSAGPCGRGGGGALPPLDSLRPAPSAASPSPLPQRPASADATRRQKKDRARPLVLPQWDASLAPPEERYVPAYRGSLQMAMAESVSYSPLGDRRTGRSKEERREWEEREEREEWQGTGRPHSAAAAHGSSHGVYGSRFHSSTSRARLGAPEPLYSSRLQRPWSAGEAIRVSSSLRKLHPHILEDSHPPAPAHAHAPVLDPDEDIKADAAPLSSPARGRRRKQLLLESSVLASALGRLEVRVSDVGYVMDGRALSSGVLLEAAPSEGEGADGEGGHLFVSVAKLRLVSAAAGEAALCRELLQVPTVGGQGGGQDEAGGGRALYSCLSGGLSGEGEQALCGMLLRLLRAGREEGGLALWLSE